MEKWSIALSSYTYLRYSHVLQRGTVVFWKPRLRALKCITVNLVTGLQDIMCIPIQRHQAADPIFSLVIDLSPLALVHVKHGFLNEALSLATDDQTISMTIQSRATVSCGEETVGDVSMWRNHSQKEFESKPQLLL